MFPHAPRRPPDPAPPDTLLWRFARRLPRPVLTLATLAFVSSLFVFWITGALRIGDPDSPYMDGRYSFIGLALMFSSLFAYFTVFSLVTSRQGGRVFAQFKNRTVPGVAISTYQHRYAESSNPVLWIIAVVTAMGLAGLQSSDLLVLFFDHPREALWAGVLSFANLAVWSFSFIAAGWVFKGSLILAEFIRDGVQLDVRDPSQLRLFTRLGLGNAALFVGILALLPIQSIDDRGPAGFVIPLIITLPSALAVWLIPVMAARARIKCAKDEELDRVQEALGAAGDGLDARSLERINALLAYRNHIEAVHEWPFGASSLLRIAIYVVIPTTAWTVAIFAEVWLERTLQ